MLTIPHFAMPNINLEEIMEHLRTTGKRTHQLWLTDDSLAFIARGREYRNEFHLNPSYEIQYSLKGELRLHYRTPDGKEEVAVVPEGSCLYQPPMVPHSPRFAPDSFQFIIERARRPGEIDTFHWYCDNCGNLLHVETYTVDDYKADPVTRAYERYNAAVDDRTCKKCGTLKAPVQLSPK